MWKIQFKEYAKTETIYDWVEIHEIDKKRLELIKYKDEKKDRYNGGNSYCLLVSGDEIMKWSDTHYKNFPSVIEESNWSGIYQCPNAEELLQFIEDIKKIV